LVVGQPHAPPSQLLPEDTVLLDEILDALLLVAVDPPRQGHEQQSQGREIGRHQPILRCRALIRVPRAGSTGAAEYSDTTGSLIARKGGVLRTRVPSTGPLSLLCSYDDPGAIFDMQTCVIRALNPPAQHLS